MINNFFKKPLKAEKLQGNPPSQDKFSKVLKAEKLQGHPPFLIPLGIHNLHQYLSERHCP